MNNIRRYRHRDYQQIAEWYIAHGMTPPDPEQLSDMGFIVDDRVAGWVYLTNSNLAVIECVISNPTTVPSMRKASLRKLAGLLVDTAVSLGCTDIMAVTRHPSIMELAQQMGFREMPDHKLFVLTEREEEPEVAVTDTEDWLR